MQTLEANYCAGRLEGSSPSGTNWRESLVGASTSLQELARIIELIAPRRCTVLVTGETGTGKEVVARAIHQASDRRQARMVAVNCSAIPEQLLEAELFGHTRGAFTGAAAARMGRFEEANHGTLFLDEIGDLPLELQAKLLRVLQERELQRLGSSETISLDVRVIAATNHDLRERVYQGKFREDLYYRLNVVALHVPPLRARAHDIPLLASHFVRQVCAAERISRKDLTAAALEHLQSYSWPGNVRELENMIERAVILTADEPTLRPEDFPLARHGQVEASNPNTFAVPEGGVDFARVVMSFEARLLDEALRKSNGNKTAAAGLLRMKRTTLVSKLRALECEPDCRMAAAS